MAATAAGPHLFPSRTEQLSPPAPMVLPATGGRVGRRHPAPRVPWTPGLFFCPDGMAAEDGRRGLVQRAATNAAPRFHQ